MIIIFGCQEGTCCVYDKNCNLNIHTKATSTSCKSKDLWVTDYALLTNANKIALAFTTKEIGKTKSLMTLFNKVY